jgi:pimeloyl-ACP methyl ester carboxylesterase
MKQRKQNRKSAHHSKEEELHDTPTSEKHRKQKKEKTHKAAKQTSRTTQPQKPTTPYTKRKSSSHHRFNLTRTKVVISGFILLLLLVLGIGPLPPFLVLHFPRNFAYDCTPEDHSLPSPVRLQIPSVGFRGEPINITAWWIPAPKTHLEQSRLFEKTNNRKSTVQQNLRAVQFNSTNTKATIIVVHGHGANMCRLIRNEESIVAKAMAPFHAAGYNILAMDLRNHGSSSSTGPISLGLYESDDVLALADWLRGNAHNLGVDPDRIGLWGESMGGATCLITCSKDWQARRIKAVVSDSSFVNARKAIGFRMEEEYKIPKIIQSMFWWWMDQVSPWNLDKCDVIHAIQQITVPVLIIHGKSDGIVSFEDGEQLYSTAIKSQQMHGRPLVVETLWHERGHVKAWKDERTFPTMVQFFERFV